MHFNWTTNLQLSVQLDRHTPVTCNPGCHTGFWNRGGNKVARHRLGAYPPPPRNFWNKVLWGEFWWVLGLSFLILYLKWWSDSKGVKIRFVGLYFCMCTSQQNMCALRLWPMFFWRTTMQVLYILKVRCELASCVNYYSIFRLYLHIYFAYHKGNVNFMCQMHDFKRIISRYFE